MTAGQDAVSTGAAPRRLPVVAKTLSAVVVFGSATYFTSEVLRQSVSLLTLRLALAFSITMSLSIGVLVTAVILAKALDQLRGQRAARRLPVIRENLARHVAGSDRGHQLARLRRHYPREFSDALVAMLESLAGASSERLSRLAIDEGLLEQWRRQAGSRVRERRVEAFNKIGVVNDTAARTILRDALNDSELRVRMIALRLLLRSRLATEIEEVFRFAMQQPLIVRAIVEYEMRHHAPLLLDLAVPQALASGDQGTIKNTLTMLRAWGVTIPAELIEPFLDDEDAGVSAAALELLPWAVPRGDHDALLRRRLAVDVDEEVRVAAAAAAGRMQVVEALEELDHCLTAGPAAVAVAAARALAMLGDEGLARLEQRIAAEDLVAAGAALEAVEKHRMGRLQEATF